MIIRKITAGPSPTQGSMTFEIGQTVYGGNEIHHIEECEDGSHLVYIKKDDEIKQWKKYSPQVPIYLEYDLDYTTNR